MFEIKRGVLTPEIFNTLVKSVGWGQLPVEQISIALEGSLYTACVVDEHEEIAMGRIFGDNSISYFIKDFVVLPKYQGKGIGKLLLSDMIAFIEDKTPEGWKVCVELMSATGKEGFYEKLGFTQRPSSTGGAGMFLMIDRRK